MSKIIYYRDFPKRDFIKVYKDFVYPNKYQYDTRKEFNEKYGIEVYTNIMSDTEVAREQQTIQFYKKSDTVAQVIGVTMDITSAQGMYIANHTKEWFQWKQLKLMTMLKSIKEVLGVKEIEFLVHVKDTFSKSFIEDMTRVHVYSFGLNIPEFRVVLPDTFEEFNIVSKRLVCIGDDPDLFVNTYYNYSKHINKYL